jgi:hypothetical protein
MVIEIGQADGVAKHDWTLEEGMAVPLHLLYPGGEYEHLWLEKVAAVTPEGGRPLLSSVLIPFMETNPIFGWSTVNWSSTVLKFLYVSTAEQKGDQDGRADKCRNHWAGTLGETTGLVFRRKRSNPIHPRSDPHAFEG